MQIYKIGMKHKKVVESIGPVDHLVNNAGFMKLQPFLSLSHEDFKTYKKEA